MVNIRTQRTRESIRDALLACMKEKHLSEISVAELCRRAGVDRTTFYRHYKDCDAVLDELKQGQLELFRTILLERRKSGAAMLRDILDSIDRAEELYGVRDGRLLPDSFKSGLVEIAKETGVHGFLERLPNLDPAAAALAYEALLAGALQAALSPEAKESREKVVFTIMDMIESYIKAHNA